MSNQHKFKTGDLVQLKSGGPIMTVVDTGYADLVCSWFAGKKHEKGSFPAAALNPAPSEPAKT
jgi:uncharacterized protein YodC (DUF2158 family)